LQKRVNNTEELLCKWLKDNQLEDLFTLEKDNGIFAFKAINRSERLPKKRQENALARMM